MNKKVLVVAVHPDDETLGCGGTLLKHKASGDEIHWLICTSVKEIDGFSEERVNSRAIEINKVCKLYSFDSVHELKLSTMRVDEYSMSELIKNISNIINIVRPNTLYLPFKSDVHSDHRKIFEATYSCSKSFRYPFIKSIYMMEVLSETEFAPSLKEDSFIPNIFIDISDYIDQKIDILQVFKSELGKHPFPRSIENVKALATFRGSMCNCKYAESFVLLKEIK